MITARSTPNIALIKYWGNRNDELRLCANDNLAMTLDTPHVDISVERSDILSVTSKSKEMTEKDTARFAKTLELIDRYLSSLSIPAIGPVAIAIDSQIPSGIGLASSAAVFSALAKAVSGLIDTELTDEQISVMARLGSGSAARSIFGGYGAAKNLDNDAIDSCIGWQVADENHWMLHDIIIAPSTEEKKVGSSEGHPKAWTSPHYEDRLEAIRSQRQQECIDAILQKDFEKLQRVAEEDAMDMHRCMQTQNPPLEYLSSETYRIIDEITVLREAEHLPVLYTMDAGPTVHLFCTSEAKEKIAEYAHAQEGCKVFEASVGSGAHLV